MDVVNVSLKLTISWDIFFCIFEIIQYLGKNAQAILTLNGIRSVDACGKSYKHFMLINYDSRVVPDWKIPHITTLES